MICKGCSEDEHWDCDNLWMERDTNGGKSANRVPRDPPAKTWCDCQHREIQK